ncbi:MAG: pilus assembly protein [Lachnospiraceae bacterium]|nr:pilus assembly protein [Lachnospiraceae bacterium]
MEKKTKNKKIKSEPLHARNNVSFSYKKLANNICEEKGSMTVEAVFVLPMLLFAICGILSLGRVYSSMDKVNHALQETGKTLALEIGETPVTKNAVRRIFEGYLPEYPENIRGVIRIDSVEYHSGTKEWEIKISYKIGIDLPLIGNYKIHCYDEIRQKAFNGFSYEDNTKDLGNYVYIAENESVYHTNGQCTYLNISKNPMLKETAETLGKTVCSHCKGSESGTIVFCTDTSDKYHNSLACGSLSRKVRIVRENQIKGMAKCSRCQKNGD